MKDHQSVWKGARQSHGIMYGNTQLKEYINRGPHIFCCRLIWSRPASSSPLSQSFFSMCSRQSLPLHVDGKGGMGVDNKTTAEKAWMYSNIIPLRNTCTSKAISAYSQQSNRLYFICILQLSLSDKAFYECARYTGMLFYTIYMYIVQYIWLEIQSWSQIGSQF